MRAIANGAEDATLPSRQRPTVLHYTFNLGGGGAEAMLMNLIESLDPTQFRTVVVAVHATPWPHQVQRLKEAGAVLHQMGRVSPAKLHAIMRAERPDIVQTWLQQSDLLGGWMARLAGVRKVIWSIHGLEIFHDLEDSQLKIELLRRALAACSRFIPTRIISCSAAAIDTHAAIGYPRSKMRWIPNGIDAGRFMPDANAGAATRGELQLPPNAPVIGYLGRFFEAKDLSTFLRAAAILQTRLPEAHFLFCGGLEAGMSVTERELLAQLPHRHQVRFDSFRADPWRVYPALDVYSLSSRTEACPMSVIEAMSCGVPCVTTDVGDCALLLKGAGSTVPMRDPEALAYAWEQSLHLDATARAEVATQSRQRVLERFTISQAAQQYADTYSELLSLRKLRWWPLFRG